MRYKLVVFDFDGTLADSFPYFLRTINVLAQQYKFPPVRPEDVEQLRGIDARQMMKLAKLPAWKIPLIANSFIRLMARDIAQIYLFDDVPDLLRQLTGLGVKLAIVSSNSEANIRRVLGTDNAALIGHYACGASLFGKPGKFRKVMAKAGVTAAETFCVGDEVRDIEAANEAGVAFGAVTWGYTRADVFDTYPTVQSFNTVAEIGAFVTGMSLPEHNQ